MGQAKIASRAIDHYLKTGRNPDPPPPPEEKKKKPPAKAPAKADEAPKAEATEKAQKTA
jgi:hypothetical protein